MDEFLNQETKNEDIDPEIQNTSDTDNVFETAETQFESEYSTVYNPIEYAEPIEQENIKPMSKGLKVFAVIMAAVILVTGGALAGYIAGNSKSNYSLGKDKVKSYINLAQKPADTDELTAAEVYEKTNKSIVGIMIYNSKGDASQASGIIISKDGYIVTNDHIYSEVAAPKFKIYTHDSKEYSAKYVAGDQISDLAVLKIENTEDTFSPAVFASPDTVFCGENVVAIGRPNNAVESSSITDGIISATSRRIQLSTTNYSSRVMQTTCPINPGSSGGALVNMYGQIVGVTSSKLVSTAYDNVGYAIPTDIVKRITDELISKGKVVSRAKLGIEYKMVDSVTAELNGQEAVGLLVASVAEDSGLYGKLEKNDMITHINGVAITDDDIVLDIIEGLKAGDKITVTILTSGGTTKNEEAVLKANVGESSYHGIDLSNDTDKKDEIF